MKRLGIFVFFDKDGVVDGYVTYLLAQIKTVLDRLVVVSNVPLPIKEREKLLCSTGDYFERENRGFDAGAYKDALCDFIGWSEVQKYDELVLLNDTFYGFFYPVETMFDKMMKSVSDFWGITLHYEIPQAELPEHVQSYFLVIRNKMLRSEVFEKWWNELNYPADFSQAVRSFEIAFSVFFLSKGFVYSSYVDVTEWETDKNFDFTVYRQYRLLSEFGCPILKRKNISTRNLDFLNDAAKSLQYVNENTGYNVNLIWENIIRLYDISMLHKNFHFNISIPDFPTVQKATCRVALLLFVNDLKNLSLLKPYLYASCIDKFYIYAYCKDFSKLIQERIPLDKANVIYLNDGVNPFSFIKEEFDYYFFLTDEISNSADPLLSDKVLFSRFDAFLKNRNYLNNLLAYMEESNRVGLLMPEDLENYFFSNDNKWNQTFTDVQNLLCDLGLSAPISANIKPFLYGKCFCAKKEAIKQLFNMNSWGDEFQQQILPYAMIYIAQANGFLSYKVKHMYIDDCSQLLQSQLSVTQSLSSTYYIQNILIRCMLDRFNNFRSLGKIFYIYGTGVVGQRIAELLNAVNIVFKGFVVSDGQQKQDALMGYPVLYISQISELKKSCFFVGVGNKYKDSVIKNLQSYGVNDYICIS